MMNKIELKEYLMNESEEYESEEKERYIRCINNILNDVKDDAIVTIEYDEEGFNTWYVIYDKIEFELEGKRTPIMKIECSVRGVKVLKM